MAAASNTNPLKLYRCGVCQNDFTSLSDCVAHMKTHSTEPAWPDQTAQTPVTTVQLQLTEAKSLDEQCSVRTVTQSVEKPAVENCPVAISKPAVESGAISAAAITQAPIVSETSTSPNSSNIARVAAPSQSTSRLKRKSIVVQTSPTGTVSVRTEVNPVAKSGNAGDIVNKGSKVKDSQVNPSAQNGGTADDSSTQKAHKEASDLEDDSRLEQNQIAHVLSASEDDAGVEGKGPVEEKSEKEGGGKTKSVKKRKRAGGEDKPHVCPHCPARYRFLSSLSTHKKRHTGGQPYQCKTCKKKFWHPTNLRVHERTHTQERPYKCDVCGHGFNQINDLRVHKRIHTGELPLKCPVTDCTRAFRDPACFRRHMAKHAGVMPTIKCDQCDAMFYHPSGLSRHYRKHTGQKDYFCDVCGAAFARSDTLKLHMRVHSGQKPYTCSACGLLFSDRSYCRRHVAKHSKDVNATIIANLRAEGCLTKQESTEAAEAAMEVGRAEEGLLEEVTALSEVDRRPAEEKRSTTVIPVQIPDPNGSDIPYASIEIEVPDLPEGDDSQEVMYQYGDVFITISRSAVELKEEPTSSMEAVGQSMEVKTEGGALADAVVPFNHQPMEHQYSRVIETEQPVHGRVEVRTVAGSDNLGRMTADAGTSMPLPLSEYNEIVASVNMMESEFGDSRQANTRVVPIVGIKPRNPRVGERRWPCPDCNAAFFHQAELRRHQTKHTGELPYECKICGKKVRDPSNLKRHIRTHTGERPYHCRVCEKSFSQAGHLTAHMRIHTGQRPYRCDQCPSTFIEANHLRYHQKVHAGIKPFKCPDCELSFIRNAELKRHMHVHSGERPFTCHLCAAKYFRMDALKQHIHMKHEHKRPYKCEVCAQTFSKRSHLDRHQATMKHGNRESPKDEEKTVDSKSDAENSVAADALCELATGRRSAVISVKSNAWNTSSSTVKSNVVLRNPDTASTNQNGPSVDSLAGAKEQVRTTLAQNENNPNSVPKFSTVAVPGDGVVTTDAHLDEIFVQRVMVDGGSVPGARVVMVESDQRMEVTESVEADSESGAVGQVQMVSADYMVPEISVANTLVVESSAEHQGQDPQQVVLIEQSDVGGEPGHVIISGPDQAVPKPAPALVYCGPPKQGPENPGSAQVTTTAVNGSGNHHYIQLAEDLPSGSADINIASSQPIVSHLTSPGGQASHSDTEADASLESTMQSLLSGEAQLETIQPVRVGKACSLGGNVEGSVIIKQEPVEGAPPNNRPFVAPLRTRSGRERKIKVKYSA